MRNRRHVSSLADFSDVRASVINRYNCLGSLVRANLTALGDKQLVRALERVTIDDRPSIERTAPVIAAMGFASSEEILALRTAEAFTVSVYPSARFVIRRVGWTKTRVVIGGIGRDTGRSRPIFEIRWEMVSPPEHGGRRIDARKLGVRPGWLTQLQNRAAFDGSALEGGLP